MPSGRSSTRCASVEPAGWAQGQSAVLWQRSLAPAEPGWAGDSDMERDDLHREVYLSEPGSYAPLARVDQVEGGRAEGLLLPYGPGWYAAGTDGQRRHNR